MSSHVYGFIIFFSNGIDILNDIYISIKKILEQKVMDPHIQAYHKSNS